MVRVYFDPLWFTCYIYWIHCWIVVKFGEHVVIFKNFLELQTYQMWSSRHLIKYYRIKLKAIGATYDSVAQNIKTKVVVFKLIFVKLMFIRLLII